MSYDNLGQIVLDMCDALTPPERLSVSQAAEKYRYINNPGAYVGPWLNSTTAYMVEPMDECINRDFNSVIFVGPAQSAKTDALVLNYLAYTIKCDPMDIILYEKSQTSSRDFSRRRVDRLHRHSPEIGSMMLPGSDSDNVFDKFYKSGMMFSISWPSINELSGKPIGRVILTDYDRMVQDVDGEGSPFDLGRKRTTTFRSAGKTVCESSPGFPVTDTRHVPDSPHEAPPCEGILSLYNRGDRRRFQWKCPFCRHAFEPSFSYLSWPDTKDFVEAGHMAKLICPHCRKGVESSMKYELNNTGRWLKDGQRWNPDGSFTGVGRRSDMASFWLKGPAASFSTWSEMVTRYLNALHEFHLTGSDGALKTTVNTDQSEPYVPQGAESERLPEDLKATSAREIGEKKVPVGARFLIATTDVQKNRFVTQIYAVTPAKVGFNLTVIDRIDTIKSRRLDDDGEHLWVKPNVHMEDWRLLIDVLKKEYELADGTGKMKIKLITCDSGGKDGVTSRAYEFWQSLRAGDENLHRRFWLTKGGNNMQAPTASVSYPDSNVKGGKAGARGEVPVLMFNTHTLKNKLSGMMDKDATEASGMILFADWLPFEIYKEMTSETLTNKGWERIGKMPNEAFDLTAYALGVCAYLRVAYFDWSNPPSWAAPWPTNDLVTLYRTVKDGPAGVAPEENADYDVSQLGSVLG